MFLYKVKSGTLIEYFSQSTNRNEIALKNKTISLPHITPVTLIRNYYLLNIDTLVCPLCDASEFDSGIEIKSRPIQLKEKTPAKKIDAGTLVQVDNSLIEKELLIITKHICYGAIVVASLNHLVVLPSNIQFRDLGPSYEYNGLKDFKTSYRPCPNCGKFSLVESISETPGYNIVCECLNCKNKIAMCWRKEI